MKLVLGKLIFRRNMYKNNNKNPKKRQKVDFVEKSGAGGMEVYLGSFAKGEFISDTKLSHSVTRSLGHSVTCSLAHSVTRSLNHLVTRSLGHLVTQYLSFQFVH